MLADLAHGSPAEHPAQRHAIHGTGMNAKADNAARRLVHGYQNPTGSQIRRFASEQIAAPQTVLRLTETGEPRRTAGIRSGPVMTIQDATDYILIDVDTERQGDLLRNPGAPPVGITALHLDHSSDELFPGSLRARSTLAL